MAKRTTKKKKTTRKKAATKKAAGTSRKTKGRTGKSTSAKSRSTTKKKMTARKKTSRKKVAARGAKKSTSKKKTTSKKKKKTTGKKTGKKKTAAKKKTTSKKTKAASSRSAKSAAKGDAGSGAVPENKKKTKKKRQTKLDARKRGRSVAEVASAAAADEQGYVFINGRRVRMISTHGKVIPKKPAAVPVEEPVADAKPEKPRKTSLSRKELNHYRQLLLIKRAEIVGDLSAMEAAALRSGGGEVSHMPIHMADIGTDTYDQDFMLGLAETERQQIREIDDALQRIEDRIYGVCQMTGEDIPKARLDAKPWAKYTIEAARIVESQTYHHR